jgi:hypothetical protein
MRQLVGWIECRRDGEALWTGRERLLGYELQRAPVAQLDRASDFGSDSRAGLLSLTVH